MLLLLGTGIASALLVSTIIVQEFNDGQCSRTALWISGLEFGFSVPYLFMGAYLQAVLMMLPTITILVCHFIRWSGQRAQNSHREVV